MKRLFLLLTIVGLATACAHQDNDEDAVSYRPDGALAGMNPPYQPTPTPGQVDLTVDPQMITDTFEIQEKFFDGQDCAVQEGCVGDVGLRRLLRFSVATINYGDVDLVLGPPSDNPELFEYSPCHDHYHLTGFADYELSSAGGSLATGHKQAFCLMDIYPYEDKPAQYYDCEYQGISSGWADIYDSSLDCQWIDITDVPPGDYQVTVSVDTTDMFNEADETNNVVTVDFTIPPAM